eukprot:GHRR01018035.1.p2 GENE.GHRR01018035.1~~GHRR01018035.1.p2  ORF type:complete len:116 (+),score=17.67 GHRR01018035.1:1756-2103(+)
MQSSASPGTGHEEELGARKLIDLCEFTYSSYASVSAQVTLDSHVEKTLQQLRVANKDERCSIGQVVYGVFRYRRFISCFLDSFYHYNRCCQVPGVCILGSLQAQGAVIPDFQAAA